MKDQFKVCHGPNVTPANILTGEAALQAINATTAVPMDGAMTDTYALKVEAYEACTTCCTSTFKHHGAMCVAGCDDVAQDVALLKHAWTIFIALMVGYFVLTMVDQIAQAYAPAASKQEAEGQAARSGEPPATPQRGTAARVAARATSGPYRSPIRAAFEEGLASTQKTKYSPPATRARSQARNAGKQQ